MTVWRRCHRLCLGAASPIRDFATGPPAGLAAQSIPLGDDKPVRTCFAAVAELSGKLDRPRLCRLLLFGFNVVPVLRAESLDGCLLRFA